MFDRTNTQHLRDEVMRLQAEVRARDMSEVKRKISEDEAKRVQDERALQEQEVRASTEELERHRVAAWVNHKRERAMAAGDESFRRFLDVPAEVFIQRQVAPGWPPGDGPENYRVQVVRAPLEEFGRDLSDTLVGRALAKKKIQI